MVGDHTETKGDVIFCKKFPRVSYTRLKYVVIQCFPNQQLLEYATESLCRNTRIWNTRVFLRPDCCTTMIPHADCTVRLVNTQNILAGGYRIGETVYCTTSVTYDHINTTVSVGTTGTVMEADAWSRANRDRVNVNWFLPTGPRICGAPLSTISRTDPTKVRRDRRCAYCYPLHCRRAHTLIGCTFHTTKRLPFIFNKRSSQKKKKKKNRDFIT